MLGIRYIGDTATPPAVIATTTPVSAATPGILTVTPQTLAIGGTSLASALSFSANESKYAGTFAELDTCVGIATISPAAGVGPSQTLTVRGIAAGTCGIAIFDTRGTTSTVAVTVTTNGFSTSGHTRT